jgi:hypothetical protein
MPNPRHPDHDPRPFGDPKPGQPEPTPGPIGDPERDKPGPDPRSNVSPAGWVISASKKVDDLSRHESRHDSDPKHDPKRNARDKPLDGTKPDAHQPPFGKPQDGDVRK